MEPQVRENQTPNSPSPSPSKFIISPIGPVDVTVSGWILEYLLRRLIEDNLVESFLPILSDAVQNLRLKETVLLRRIQAEIAIGRISEKLLEYLELVEELDPEKNISESMKKAYCAVAVDSTLKHLEGTVDDRGKYFDAVVRIWRGRISDLEKSRKSSLLSKELYEWKTDIEKAVWNTTTCKMVMQKSAKNVALQAVEAYLKEAWEGMGPSLLESFARKTITGCSQGKTHQVVELVSDHIVREMPGSPNDNPDRAASSKDLPNESKDVSALNIEEEVQKRPRKRSNADNGRNCTQKATHRKLKVSKFHDSEGSNKEILNGKYDRVSSAETSKAQMALRSSSLDLQLVVKDPLPEAMHLSETRFGDARVDSADAPAHLGMVVSPALDDGGSCAIMHAETVQGNSDDLANSTREPAQTSEGHMKNQNVSRPSLMDRNCTARNYEWNDSEDSPDGRICLPNPTKVDVSPLKRIDVGKVTSRRRNKRWTSAEEDALRTAVQKHGKGKWKVILSLYSEMFEERTEVDLKDKWRNMTR